MAFENIMIIDDDVDILSQMDKIFKKLKINHVKKFTLAQDAIKELETLQTEYDVVFIDVKMPSMPGVGLIQFIKGHKEKKIKELFCVPIVGQISKEETTVLNELNCYENVIKPISESVFVKKFHELTEIHTNPNSEKNFNIQFQNALLEKKYSQAESLILPKVKKEPNSPKFLTLYAELLMKAKQWPKAEEFLNKVLKIDSNYVSALNLLSKIYIKSGKYDDAMILLEKAKNLSPLHIDRLLVIGELHLGAGESQKAEDNFRNALKVNPAEEKAAFGLGRALATQGKIEESKKILSSLQKGDELVSFFNNKGILLVRSGQILEGISLYQNALKVMEEKEREYLLLYNIALAYSKLNQYENALDFAKQAMSKSPKGYDKPEILRAKMQAQLDALNAISENTKEDQKSVESQKVELVSVVTETKIDPPKQDFLMTGNQMEFIMGGFGDDEPKKEAPKDTKEEEPKAEEEFITFGL